MFYYFFGSNGVPWRYPPMACRTLGALLCGGVLMGGFFNNYISVFYFFLYFGKIFKYVWFIGEPLGLF